MFGATRATLFALICSAALAGGSLTAAAKAVDTTGLPQMPGAKILFANPSTTSFTTQDSVAQAGETVGQALAADGWQRYVPVFAQEAQNASLRIMSFKKAAQALSVFITVAPAQGNATSVSYTALVLPNDLPFPKDATLIEFDPNRPHLNCVTGDSVDATLAFFRQELGAMGWSYWSAKDGTRDTGSTGERTERGAYAYYVHDDRRPLLLTLQRGEGDRLKIELKGVPAESLVTASTRKPEVRANPTPPAKVEALRTATDDLAGEMMKQAMETMRSAAAEALSGAKAQPLARAPAASGAPLRAQTDSPAPIPVPDTAEDLEFDGSDGSVEFTSTSSVPALASFYRAAMKPLGWRDRPSVINRANMVVIDFTRDGKNLTFTIMQMGAKANVRANGTGLVAAAAKRDLPANGQTTAAPTAIQELEAEDVSGIPVPKGASLKGSETTPFRLVVTANVSPDLASVLAFYRRELGKLAWKEEAVLSNAEEAKLVYASPEGPVLLKINRKDDETAVELILRKPAEAAKAGVMPKPGRSKVLFGNILDKEAVVTINRQNVKVGAGVGAKAPDGPTLDLPPGKYKFSFKVAGGPAKIDEVQIGADETWGVLIGPGGALTLHVY